MRFTSVDTITRSVLIQKRLPLHYYLQILKYSCDCLRELYFDSLLIVNTVELTVNQEGHFVDLPCDYVDFTKVGVRRGQFVQPITQRDSLNRLQNHDTTGNVIDYGGVATANFEFPFWPGYWLFQNIDDLGENLGRLYGFNTGAARNGFKVIRERGQMQLTETFNSPTLILEYISDGQTVNNASKVDPLAQSTIEAYDKWKISKNSDIEQSPEGLAYFNQRRILRARKNELTPWDIRQIIYSNYILAPKQ